MAYHPRNLTFEPGGNFGSSASSVKVVGTGPFCIPVTNVVSLGLKL
jgi:hypothetical protein